MMMTGYLKLLSATNVHDTLHSRTGISMANAVEFVDTLHHGWAGSKTIKDIR